MSEVDRIKVAIIGAGPAGCTLANLLLKEPHIEVLVFEGEKDLSIRAQGGSLDLHTETGQKALRKAGLFDEFLKYARFDGEALAVVDKHKTAVLKLPGANKNSTRGRPEIDRVRLRRILIDSLPKNIVQWGKRVQSVNPKDLSIEFEDHTIVGGFDLVVGADGAWSKVRPVLSSAQPYFTGLGGVDMVIEKPSERYPHIDSFVRRGSVFAFSDGKGITLQQRGDDNITVYAWGTRDENWQQDCEIDVKDPIQLKAHLIKEFADWDPLFKEALEATDNKQMVARSLYVLPVGHQWPSRPGVTVLGDAAHLMTPFAGEGVNVAMEDALKLSEAIITARKMGGKSKAFINSIRLFEVDMFHRSAPIAEDSRLQMEDMFFVPGAPQATIASWVRRATIGNGWLMKLLLPLWLIKLVLRLTFWW